MWKKEFSFYFIKFCHINAFFMKEFKWKIFTNCKLANFAIKRLYI